MIESASYEACSTICGFPEDGWIPQPPKRRLMASSNPNVPPAAKSEIPNSETTLPERGELASINPAVTPRRKIRNSKFEIPNPVGVLGRDEAALFRKMAGYRNRMVHLYDDVTTEELYQICSGHLDDFDTIIDPIMTWLRQNPEKLDTEI